MGQNFERLNKIGAPLQIKKFQLILSSMYLNLSFQLDFSWHTTFYILDIICTLAVWVSSLHFSYNSSFFLFLFQSCSFFSGTFIQKPLFKFFLLLCSFFSSIPLLLSPYFQFSSSNWQFQFLCSLVSCPLCFQNLSFPRKIFFSLLPILIHQHLDQFSSSAAGIDFVLAFSSPFSLSQPNSLGTHAGRGFQPGRVWKPPLNILLLVC